MTEDFHFRVKTGESVEVEWEIKRFLDLPKRPGYKLKSPLFTFCNATWFICLWPNGFTRWTPDWISLYLEKDPSSSPLHLTFMIGVKKADGSILKAFNGTYAFGQWESIRGYEVSIRKSELQTESFIRDPDVNLIIFCIVRMEENLPTALETSPQTSQNYYLLEKDDCKREITELKEKFAVASKENDHCKKEITELKEKLLISKKENDDCRREIAELKGKSTYLSTKTSALNIKIIEQNVKQADSALAVNIRELFRSRYEADTTVRVGDKEFLVHKVILAARSSVFRTMFETDMTERKDGIVNIEDCEPAHFEDFLLFIYSGQYDVVRPSNALKLCLIADKYNVVQLKEACFEVMKNEMSAESVSDALYLATLYNKGELLNAATSYFIENMGKVVITQKWISFLTEHPTIANELFVKMAEKNAK